MFGLFSQDMYCGRNFSLHKISSKISAMQIILLCNSKSGTNLTSKNGLREQVLTANISSHLCHYSSAVITSRSCNGQSLFSMRKAKNQSYWLTGKIYAICMLQYSIFHPSFSFLVSVNGSNGTDMHYHFYTEALTVYACGVGTYNTCQLYKKLTIYEQ